MKFNIYFKFVVLKHLFVINYYDTIHNQNTLIIIPSKL